MRRTWGVGMVCVCVNILKEQLQLRYDLLFCCLALSIRRFLIFFWSVNNWRPTITAKNENIRFYTQTQACPCEVQYECYLFIVPISFHFFSFRLNLRLKVRCYMEFLVSVVFSLFFVDIVGGICAHSEICINTAHANICMLKVVQLTARKLNYTTLVHHFDSLQVAFCEPELVSCNRMRRILIAAFIIMRSAD